MTRQLLVAVAVGQGDQYAEVALHIGAEQDLQLAKVFIERGDVVRRIDDRERQGLIDRVN